ncbi:nuclear transport factor 2 family protein [Streptomyces sp. NPDC093221]|uniref:nuclear transport factor 2 family protein n=1 Tax=Streptomyces sp. NPDC093221 TaxID=3366032 RepID=UPI00382DA960
MTATDAVTADPSAFRAAVESGDVEALSRLFTDDIRLYSPVKFTPFEGKPLVVGLFHVLVRTFEDFRYIGRFDGSARTTGDGTDAPSAILLFRATVNGKEIHGIDMLQFDPAGLIKEITVMVRPQSAVQTLGEAVLAGLVADGLAPTPAPAPR